MTEPIGLFINERPIRCSAESTVLDAIGVADTGLASAVTDGRAYVTDGVGRRLDPATPASTGSIVRVVVSARRREGVEESL